MKRNSIYTGGIITANRGIGEYHLTEGEKYQILGIDGECILVMSDIGEQEWVSKDCFIEFA